MARENWINPISQLAIIKAFKRKEELVVLDGRLFKIVWDHAREQIYITPSNGDFVPCGWFDFKTIREWEVLLS